MLSGVYEVVAGHFGRLGYAHDVEDGRGYVGEDAVFNCGGLVVGYVDAWHGVERMGGVGCSVGIDGVIGVAMVGDYDCLIAGGLGSLDGVAHAVVNSLDSLFDCLVYAGMAYHVAVGEVHHDEVIFLAADGFDEFVFDFIGAHFRLKVVGGHFGGGDEDAALPFEFGFASAVEEECHMGVFLCFGNVELVLAFLCEIFAEGVLHVLFGE